MKSFNLRSGSLLLGYCVFALTGCTSLKEAQLNKKRIDELENRINLLTKDTDGDGVSDHFDNDTSTPAGVPVDGGGRAIDSDMDGVPDHIDVDPFSNRGAHVNSSGLESDSDEDGVPDSADIEPNTRPGASVDLRGREIEQLRDLAMSSGPGWDLKKPPYEYLPDFVLAPPTATDKLNDVLNNVGTIGQLCSKIENALEKADLESVSYAEIPGVGIALISTGHRYSPVNGFNESMEGYGLLKQPQFSIFEILEELRYKVKQKARFRYFVFIIGFDWGKFQFDLGKVANTDALNLLLKPNKGLPDLVLHHKIPEGTFVQAIIYEFEVSSLTGDKVMLTPETSKTFTAMDHLNRSGILKNLKP